jgi:general secretion pathway protein K
MNRRGVVLISVLWVVLILSLVSFSLASAVRAELSTSQNSFDSDRAFFMARGAAEVIYRSFVNKQELPESSRVRRINDEYVFTFDSGEARVRFESDTGLIDINRSPDKVLVSMFDSLGLNEQTRNQLVDSILDWRDSDDIPHLHGAEVSEYLTDSLATAPTQRPRNGPFDSVDELLFVKNITPDIFYGSLSFDPATREYRRIPGLRDLLTVNSPLGRVDPNRASLDVLAALPRMTRDLVVLLAAERNQMPFTSIEDIVDRVPGMFEHEALQYLTLGNQVPSMIMSRATISSSGVSRTVRMLFKREETTQILAYAPLIYRRVESVKFNRWQYE